MGFLDGVKKKGTEISNNLQESINKQQKISTLKKTITENNSKIEGTFSEIGKKVYEKKTMDEEIMTYISDKIEEIDKMKAENEELEKEQLVLKNKKRCPNCGSEVDINATFCPQCGKEQEKIEVEPFVPNGKRKCSGCGKVIDDSNVFCPNCGVKKEEIVEEKEEVVVEETKEVLPEGKRKCANCGEIINSDDEFCSNCGAKKE